MTEHPHTTEGDIECSCNPLSLTVSADGSISRIAGGPLEEPVNTGAAPRATTLDVERLAVRETPEQAFDSWDNQDAEVAAQSHSVESRAARSGELPLIGRATARNTGGRP